MPTYEYKCLECDHKFEAFQSMKDDPLESCPECEGNVKRLISSGAGLIFKGSGFYITDYRGDGYKEAAKKDKEAASGSSDGKSKSDSGESKGSSGESKGSSGESKGSSGESKGSSGESKGSSGESKGSSGESKGTD
ncbi:TPA: zinc ribbon domain-containing protein [Candidatus Poribacteria bacterium]|nr:zinc ribbon domain-containing protein [Candidatus Poribacteria bacterium]